MLYNIKSKKNEGSKRIKAYLCTTLFRHKKTGQSTTAWNDDGALQG